MKRLSLPLTVRTRYAYIEFANQDAVNNAVALSDSVLKGRQIKVCQEHFLMLLLSDFLSLMNYLFRVLSTIALMSPKKCHGLLRLHYH